MLSDPIASEWFLLCIRILLGAIMIRYGWPKVKDFKKNSKDFEKMGYKPGWFWGTPISLLETIGGAAIILGVVPEIIAFFYAFMMMVGSFWKLKTKTFGSASYDMCVFILCMSLLFFGTGYYNLYPAPLSIPLLRWDIALLGIIASLIMAFLPQILGKRYREWTP